MDNWEETVIEDTFPEAGEIYFLRPRGNPPSVQTRTGNWGDYYMLNGMFWIYTDQDPENPNITRDSPMIIHKFNIKPGVLHDFLGKWDDTNVFHCECKLKGNSKRLQIIKTYKAPVVHSSPPTPSPPNPESEVVQAPIDSPERPPALPPVCAHPALERTYTNDTTYVCGVCDKRVVVV